MRALPLGRVSQIPSPTQRYFRLKPTPTSVSITNPTVTGAIAATMKPSKERNARTRPSNALPLGSIFSANAVERTGESPNAKKA